MTTIGSMDVKNTNNFTKTKSTSYWNAHTHAKQHKVEHADMSVTTKTIPIENMEYFGG